MNTTPLYTCFFDYKITVDIKDFCYTNSNNYQILKRRVNRYILKVGKHKILTLNKYLLTSPPQMRCENIHFLSTYIYKCPVTDSLKKTFTKHFIKLDLSFYPKSREKVNFWGWNLF